MHFKVNTAFVFAATASALQVTSPTKDTNVDLSKSTEITWSHVESDPTSFDIELVNEHVNPAVAKTIATNVQTSAGSYTFSNLDAAAGREGYQINFISNEPQNTGILAQSPGFDVSNASGSSSTLSAESSTTSGSSTSTGSSSATTSTTGTFTSTSMSMTSGASSSASKTASASHSGVSSSSTAQPSTGAASALGVSAVGSVVGGVLALLL
ncbi:Ser-Thr-rich glycosyl-phosphatidyl-inositol-anchored membrane family-domain-containing protein [Talaromyces proteolyticus]|uniref:Ser-Thr-rich glycosyl-phosphatidyl-inositol-anchored membrane family-domain-containing protein n=1 Tax=Talaromyces proteolyticus TaxID=1131652 RepID=A0AAD4KZZ1_9EURO|nr:Ser-Thr-rich glycosyl-phosphatidyl-inositol-anchored membrane family-domain-containing protein [Talaromyces proteolyticus]KAH8705002.1 Ser-Thr-rich glycosyl-phosphatidyl-inositol-anchored membrane family-domain-containing protein [Talaromyces proteolyticus]